MVGISKCLNPFCIHLISMWWEIYKMFSYTCTVRSRPMPRLPGSTHIKPVGTVSNGLSLRISFRALWRYFCWQSTWLKGQDEGISHPLLYLRRFLSDRLGVLLHGGRGGGCHAAVRLAVLFRREEAEALPVLRSRRRRQRQGHKRMSKTGSSLKSCSWMKNVWTNPTCKDVTSHIPLTKRVSSLDSCLLIHGCFWWWCTPWWRKKSDIASL